MFIRGCFKFGMVWIPCTPLLQSLGPFRIGYFSMLNKHNLMFLLLFWHRFALITCSEGIIKNHNFLLGADSIDWLVLVYFCRDEITLLATVEWPNAMIRNLTLHRLAAITSTKFNLGSQMFPEENSYSSWICWSKTN